MHTKVTTQSVQASVAFLSVVTGHEPAKLRAVIGPFYDRRLEEFRISFGPADSDEVYHGVVWPLLGAEVAALRAGEGLRLLGAVPTAGRGRRGRRVLRGGGVEVDGLGQRRVDVEPVAPSAN